jgi:hypothetical protein
MSQQTAENATLALSEVSGEIRRRLRHEKVKLLISQAIAFLLVAAFIMAL